MKGRNIRNILTISLASVLLCACDSKTTPIEPSANVYKSVEEANPISSNVFCADPTAVEYEGRLYVYGTNDHQQYENAEKNTYEKIKSLVCFSTSDMVNWTYHGIINTEKIAPWIQNSWAPSITSRIEEDGKTHFYLYFSNSGSGVGVITATSPIGPWSDPRGKALIAQKQPEIGDSPNPFDPGVVIDDEGNGWLAFGGGVAKSGSEEMPGSARIAKLGKDLISLEAVSEIKAPYFFEASELNYINGTYVYTLNTNWIPRNAKTWKYKGIPMPANCSMAYMTSKTPLDTDSWEYQGHYFLNPGEAGMEYSNNHTHIHRYKGQNYIFYHSMILQEKAPTHGGFRSLMVDSLSILVNTVTSTPENGIQEEKSVTYVPTKGTRKGVNAIENLDPYQTIAGTTMFTSADIDYEDDENPEGIMPVSNEAGAWLCVKNVDFGANARKIAIEAKGTGNFEIRMDSLMGETIASMKLDEVLKTRTSKLKSKPSGVHDLYILFSDKGIALKNWKFQ